MADDLVARKGDEDAYIVEVARERRRGVLGELEQLAQRLALSGVQGGPRVHRGSAIA